MTTTFDPPLSAIGGCVPRGPTWIAPVARGDLHMSKAAIFRLATTGRLAQPETGRLSLTAVRPCGGEAILASELNRHTPKGDWLNG